jgi:hypothetical protein
MAGWESKLAELKKILENKNKKKTFENFHILIVYKIKTTNCT